MLCSIARVFRLPSLLKPCLALAAAALFLAPPARAQFNVPPAGTQVHDPSALKPPPGARVAIVEWEDMECPDCARANPLLKEAAEKYNIPWVRHDFPLPFHAWSFTAAVNARWFDTRSKKLGDDYRDAVFANQNSIYYPGRAGAVHAEIRPGARHRFPVRGRSAGQAGRRSEGRLCSRPARGHRAHAHHLGGHGQLQGRAFC